MQVDLVMPNPPISAESPPVSPPSFLYFNTNIIFYFCLIDRVFRLFLFTILKVLNKDNEIELPC